MPKLTLAGAAALALTTLSFPLAATAQQSLASTGALKLHAGPGSNFTLLEVVPVGARIVVNSCIAESGWCAVSTPIEDGWIYAPNLAGRSEKALILTEEGPAD